MNISIIIRTKDEENCIGHVLAQIYSQDIENPVRLLLPIQAHLTEHWTSPGNMMPGYSIYRNRNSAMVIHSTTGFSILPVILSAASPHTLSPAIINGCLN